jgi:predicted Rossmann-fold nucleotide-binding protein
MHERKIKIFRPPTPSWCCRSHRHPEEAVKLLSWRRLGLHAKPIVFYDPGGFWRPLFDLFDQFIADRLVPAEFRSCWDVVERIEDVIPALRAMPTGRGPVMRVVA